MISLTERTWTEIHPQNILHNMKMIRDSVPEGTKFLGVVKANAYGHGALTVAKALEENGADYLAVACIAEAVELREAGIRMPILILGVTPQADIPLLLRYDITQTVAGSRSAAAYSAAFGCHRQGAPHRMAVDQVVLPVGKSEPESRDRQSCHGTLRG